MMPHDDSSSVQEADLSGTTPEGYGVVAELLQGATRALEAEKVSDQGWVRIRQSMPDSSGSGHGVFGSPWRWLLLGGGLAAAAAVAMAIIPGDPRLGSGATPLTAVGAPATDAESLRGHELASTHSELAPGDVVSATQEPRRIRAFGRHAMTLEAGTEIRVERWEPDHIQLALAKGSIHCDIEPTPNHAPAGRFEVVAGETRVKVVGTRFTVRRDEAGMATVEVQRGEVAVSREGVTRTLLTGDQWVETARAPEETTTQGKPTVGKVAVAKASEKTARRRSKIRRRAMAPVAAPGSEPTSEQASKATPSAAEGPHDAAHVKPSVGSTVKTTTTVDIEVKASDVVPAPVASRALLSSAVGLIRAGRCGAAKAKLRKLYHRLDAKTPPDLFYLMGYCLHSEGKLTSAKAFFARYRRLSPTRRFKVPGPGVTIAPPHVGQLAR